MTDRGFNLKIDNQEVIACARELLSVLREQLTVMEAQTPTDCEEPEAAPTVKGKRANKRDDLKALGTVVGLTARRVKTIMSESQKLTSLPLSQISDIIKGCQRWMDSKGESASDSLLKPYFDFTNSICKALDGCGISPTEYAFLAKFKVDPAKQNKFSDSYGGNYAIIRLTNNTRLAITPIKIHEIKKGEALCRFTSAGVSKSLASEQNVTGYIFESEEGIIHAVGAIEKTDHIRSTLMARVPGKQDLYGLRLAVSRLDGGAFAYRLYLKRVFTEDNTLWPENWNPIFTLHRLDEKSINAVRERISDLDWILSILREPPADTAKHWGLAFPVGDID